MTDVTLADQLACVEREIERRVFFHDFDQPGPSRAALVDLDRMRAVAETLRGLMEIGDIRLPGTRPDRGISPIVVWPEDTK